LASGSACAAHIIKVRMSAASHGYRPASRK
jgi:hypothetical protein